jgi:hypothetical protein
VGSTSDFRWYRRFARGSSYGRQRRLGSSDAARQPAARRDESAGGNADRHDADRHIGRQTVRPHGRTAVVVAEREDRQVREVAMPCTEATEATEVLTADPP